MITIRHSKKKNNKKKEIKKKKRFDRIFGDFRSYTIKKDFYEHYFTLALLSEKFRYLICVKKIDLRHLRLKQLTPLLKNGEVR